MKRRNKCLFYLGTATTPFLNNPDAIQRVAQSLPTHMVQSLSAVANQTPHYPHTPGGATANNYFTTPYTPSGQTPFMTPYQTPRCVYKAKD